MFVAINPLKIESFINSIIESIDSFDSSGDIFKKRGILTSSSIAFLSIELSKFFKSSLL